MQTLTDRYEALLRESIEYARSTAHAAMSMGLSLEQYHQQVGIVRACGLFEEALEEIRKQLEKGD